MPAVGDRDKPAEVRQSRDLEPPPVHGPSIIRDVTETGPPPPRADRARASDPMSGLVGVLREAPLSLLGLAGVSVFLFWAPSNAGYDPVVWYPGALAFLALLVSVVLSAGTDRSPRLLLGAIAAFAAFAALNYASIAWADMPGVAFDGANRTLLYVCVFAVFALIPWRERAAALVVGIYSAGIAVLAVVTLVRAAASGNPGSFFIGGQLSEPAGYSNANAALFLTAAWPALYLASRRWLQPALRIVALACAGVLFNVSLLSQSRGGVLATVIVTPLFVALVSRRGRVIITMALVGIASAVAAPSLLDVYSATSVSTAAVEHALRHAERQLAVAIAILVALGAAWVWIDAHLDISHRVEKLVTTALRAGAAIVVLAGVVGLLAAHPLRHLDNAWSSFRHAGSPTGSTSRFVSLGSNRYDFYRVALREFRDHPFLGVGSDGFAVDYVRERRSDEEPLYPHSSLLRIPAQTGLVGAVLVLLFAGFVAKAVLSIRRTSAWPTAAALLVTFGYMALHSAADWLWEFPGLTGPALMYAGIVVGLLPRSQPQPASPRGRSTWRRLVLVPPVAAGALLFGFPWLAAREVDSASAAWRSSPQAAFAQLDRAARLNPLSAQPYLIAGAIASRLGDRTRIRLEFERALTREPDNWYATLELGVLESQLGEWTNAVRLLERAKALDPLEPTVAYALRRVKNYQSVSFDTLDAVYRQRVARRLGSGLRGA